MSKYSKQRYSGKSAYHEPQRPLEGRALTPREEAPAPTDPIMAGFIRRLNGTSPARRAMMGIGKQRLALTIYAAAWADCITAVADSLPQANAVPFKSASPVVNGRF